MYMTFISVIELIHTTFKHLSTYIFINLIFVIKSINVYDVIIINSLY